MPSLPGLKLVQVVSRPPSPKGLELLPPGQSTGFDGSIVDGRQLGKGLANEKMSGRKKSTVRVVRQGVERSGIQT